MAFNAIVHAPRLRIGARVNIAEADQATEAVPSQMAMGAEIRIRFGVCCPDLAGGHIVDVSSEPDRVVIAVKGEQWILLKGASGISTPGLVSDDWFVAPPAAD